MLRLLHDRICAANNPIRPLFLKKSAGEWD
jgi:hypothetical protein